MREKAYGVSHDYDEVWSLRVSMSSLIEIVTLFELCDSFPSSAMMLVMII